MATALVGPTFRAMEILHSLAGLAGRLMKPLRSGERHLASRQLNATAARDLEVTSPAFADGAPMPDAYAGSDGRSPPLRFGAVPGETRELVLLVEDPDAPLPRPFVHWILFGLPRDGGELPEGLPPSAMPLASGAQQGRNTLRKDGYLGPTPIPGTACIATTSSSSRSTGGSTCACRSTAGGSSRPCAGTSSRSASSSAPTKRSSYSPVATSGSATQP